MTPCLVGPTGILEFALAGSCYIDWRLAFVLNEFFFLNFYVSSRDHTLVSKLAQQEPLLTEPFCWPMNSLFKDFW